VVRKSTGLELPDSFAAFEKGSREEGKKLEGEESPLLGGVG